MSLETLRRMQEYYRDEDRAIDARESKRSAERKVILSEEETQKQGEELYAKVVKSITKQLTTEGKKKAQVSCKLRPNSVFKYVVDKLRAKGWTARHSYNDGYNDYDFVEATPPDTLTPLLKALSD